MDNSKHLKKAFIYNAKSVPTEVFSVRNVNLITVLTVVFLLSSTSYADQHVKDFTLPSATDVSLIRLSDYSGKVVPLNWWRTSCPWSQRQAPMLVELYAKYRDQGLEIPGIADDNTDTVQDVPAYINRFGITWPIGLNDQGEFRRENRSIGRGETPGSYLVSRDGQIHYIGLYRSDDDWDLLVRTVVDALEEPVPQEPAILQRDLEVAPAFSLPDLAGKTVKLEDFSGNPLVVNLFTSKTCDWTGVNKGGAMFFVTPDGKFLKKIINSINNGIEEAVFRKYSEYLLANLDEPVS